MFVYVRLYLNFCLSFCVSPLQPSWQWCTDEALPDISDQIWPLLVSYLMIFSGAKWPGLGLFEATEDLYLVIKQLFTTLCRMDRTMKEEKHACVTYLERRSLPTHHMPNSPKCQILSIVDKDFQRSSVAILLSLFCRQFTSPQIALA